MSSFFARDKRENITGYRVRETRLRCYIHIRLASQFYEHSSNTTLLLVINRKVSVWTNFHPDSYDCSISSFYLII